eukprot:Skav202399  [mRNA]  locus=scaffold815:336351:338624:+ [translate_table: standard]
MVGWSLLTLDLRFAKLRSRLRNHVPTVSLRWWQWALIVCVAGSFVKIGLIAVEPYRADLRDHADRVNFWARTMKARIPILEAKVHLELWKLGRLPDPLDWTQDDAACGAEVCKT